MPADYSIDRERMYSILDTGAAAAASLAGIRDEHEALRTETANLELGIRVATETSLGSEPAPQSARRLAGRKEQLQRLQNRRTEAEARLMPRVELARRALAHARKHGLGEEVSGYVF